jgi:hypothetical protein
MHTLCICIIDDVDEEHVSEQQEVITAKEAKCLFNLHIDDEIDEISYPLKFVQSTLDNYIKQ